MKKPITILLAMLLTGLQAQAFQYSFQDIETHDLLNEPSEDTSVHAPEPGEWLRGWNQFPVTNGSDLSLGTNEGLAEMQQQTTDPVAADLIGRQIGWWHWNAQWEVVGIGEEAHVQISSIQLLPGHGWFLSLDREPGEDVHDNDHQRWDLKDVEETVSISLRSDCEVPSFSTDIMDDPELSDGTTSVTWTAGAQASDDLDGAGERNEQLFVHISTLLQPDCKYTVEAAASLLVVREVLTPTIASVCPGQVEPVETKVGWHYPEYIIQVSAGDPRYDEETGEPTTDPSYDVRTGTQRVGVLYMPLLPPGGDLPDLLEGLVRGETLSGLLKEVADATGIGETSGVLVLVPDDSIVTVYYGETETSGTEQNGALLPTFEVPSSGRCAEIPRNLM